MSKSVNRRGERLSKLQLRLAETEKPLTSNASVESPSFSETAEDMEYETNVPVSPPKHCNLSTEEESSDSEPEDNVSMGSELSSEERSSSCKSLFAFTSAGNHDIASNECAGKIK